MHVVVALDGSKYSQWALDWAGRLQFSTPTRVTAVHAIDVASVRSPVMVQAMGLAAGKALDREVNRLLRHGKQVQGDAARRLSDANIKGTARIRRGPVTASVLNYAKRHGLVIVGHRGLDAMDRFLLGSTSVRIVREARCPVLVVKEPPKPLARIVLAIDGSKPSQKAVHFLASTLAPGVRSSIEVTVCHAMPFLQYPELKTSRESLVRQAANALLHAGYRVIEAPRIGHPADEILKVADKHGADLIVIGAVGHGAIARMLLGSVSSRVLEHATESVLIVR